MFNISQHIFKTQLQFGDVGTTLIYRELFRGRYPGKHYHHHHWTEPQFIETCLEGDVLARPLAIHIIIISSIIIIINIIIIGRNLNL